MPDRTLIRQVQYALYRAQRFVGLRYRDEIEALQGRLAAVNDELDQRQLRLERAARSVDHLFRLQFQDYITGDILPRAERVKAPDFAGKRYTKTFVQTFGPFKVGTAYQLFCLELDCVARLNEVIAATGRARHFPVLVDFDAEALTITFSDDGDCVSDLGTPVTVPDVEGQLDAIVDTMAAAGVIHLDMHKNGKNLLVDAAGHLTLVDFDIAQANGVSFNWSITRLLDKPQRRATKDAMRDALRANAFIAI